MNLSALGVGKVFGHSRIFLVDFNGPYYAIMVLDSITWVLNSLSWSFGPISFFVHACLLTSWGESFEESVNLLFSSLKQGNADFFLAIVGFRIYTSQFLYLFSALFISIWIDNQKPSWKNSIKSKFLGAVLGWNISGMDYICSQWDVLSWASPNWYLFSSSNLF